MFSSPSTVSPPGSGRPENDPLLHSVSARAEAKHRVEIVAAAFRVRGSGLHGGSGCSSVDFRARAMPR